MKTQTQASLQFSGYPLKLASKDQLNQPHSDLLVVASFHKKLSKKDQHQPDLANNPENWDTGWFNNYE